MDAARPDQVVRSHHLERSRHLLGVEIAALPHHVFEKRDLALVDEQHQFAGLSEIDLGGEQADRSQPLVTVARHGRGGHGEQRSAEAITDCMHFARPGDGGRRLDRRQHAFGAIFVETDVAVLSSRIFPGHHEHGETLLREKFDQRVRRRQVEYVIFHDPSRHDHDRLRTDAFGRWRVLDDFGKTRAKHDLARRHRHCFPDLECFRAAWRCAASRSRQVSDQVRVPAHQIGARFDTCAGQYLGVGRDEI